MKMKAIKFTEANAEKINAILSDVNGRAVDHTLRSFGDIVKADDQTKKAENLVGGKKHAVGMKVLIESGDKVPNAYKYNRVGTIVTLEMRSSGWFITDICRTNLWASGGKSVIIMTPSHHERAIEVLKRGYFVTTGEIA
jgi:hypothetical protein